MAFENQVLLGIRLTYREVSTNKRAGEKQPFYIYNEKYTHNRSTNLFQSRLVNRSTNN